MLSVHVQPLVPLWTKKSSELTNTWQLLSYVEMYRDVLSYDTRVSMKFMEHRTSVFLAFSVFILYSFSSLVPYFFVNSFPFFGNAVGFLKQHEISQKNASTYSRTR